MVENFHEFHETITVHKILPSKCLLQHLSLSDMMICEFFALKKFNCEKLPFQK